MATDNHTHLHKQEESTNSVLACLAQSTFAHFPAAAGLELSTEIIVRTPYSDIAEYQGTRAALEAEGVIPVGTKWPKDFNELHWEDDGFRYWMRRERPEGAKGPRKQLVNVDWWMLRFVPLNRPSPPEMAIMRKIKALNDEIYRQSAKGRAEYNELLRRYCMATDDERFQAFKALVPGLIPPKRGRLLT